MDNFPHIKIDESFLLTCHTLCNQMSLFSILLNKNFSHVRMLTFYFSLDIIVGLKLKRKSIEIEGKYLFTIWHNHWDQEYKAFLRQLYAQKTSWWCSRGKFKWLMICFDMLSQTWLISIWFSAQVAREYFLVFMNCLHVTGQTCFIFISIVTYLTGKLLQIFMNCSNMC